MSSLALNLFLIPEHIVPGGVSALSAMAASVTPLSVGIWYAVLNIPLFLLGLKIDKSFFFKSLLGVLMSSVFVDVLKSTGALIPLSGEDLIIASIFGGALMGLGYSLVLAAGGSSGGTDIAGWLLKKVFPHMSMGVSILLFDITVIAIQGIVYSSIKSCLYAAIALFISSKVIDGVLEGVNFTKVAYIISDKAEEVASRIMSELGRGVTGFHAKGMYTGNDKTVILCTVHRTELAHVKRIVKEVDAGAFVILSDARETFGEGFNTTIK